MSPLRHLTATDPGLLLRHAAAGFLAPPRATPEQPFPSVGYLLALRQGGLRDDVIALAAQAGVAGWFDPPLCTFHELTSWLGAPARPTLGDQERRVLLGSLLPSAAPRVFGRLKRPDAFIDALDSLFGELVAEGVAPARLSAALAARGARDAFERDRDDDIAATFAAYVDRCDALGKADGRSALRHCADSIAADAQALRTALGGRREIRIFGLSDLRGGWRALLGALAASPALDTVLVYSTSALPLESLGVIQEALEEPASPAALLYEEPTGQPLPGATTILAAPDAERELDEIARRVRALIVDGGVAPHRIAIVSRKARPHTDLALASLERFGVPAIARRRIGLAEIPSVRAVRSLFSAAADGWSRAGLVELARHPYVDCALDARVLDVIGYRRRVLGLAEWETAIRALESEAKRRERQLATGEEIRGRALPPLESIVATRECFGPFAARAKALDVSRTLGEWLAWLADLLEHDRWGIARRMKVLPLDRYDLVRRDVAGWEAMTQLVREWHDAVREIGHAGDVLTVAELDQRLGDALAGDVAVWTPMQRGVQVLEALAAAYRSFDHVFVVGMEAGQFPVPPARSPVLDEAERESLIAAGIPLDPPAVREQRERELFRVLVAGAARSLTVSHACLDANGSEVIRSSFVDALADVAQCRETKLPAHEVLVRGVPLAMAEAAREQAVVGAAIERERRIGGPSRYDGMIERPDLVAWLAGELGDDRVWSATQLEELAKCPWSYLSKRLLRLERLEDPREDIEPSVRGRLLHDVLKRFFDAARERAGGPVFIRQRDLDAWIPASVDEHVAAAFGAMAGTWLGHPALEQAIRGEVRRIALGYLAWEVALHEEMLSGDGRKAAPKMIRTGVEAHELAFDDMEYEHDGVRIRYRGSIDRVEVSEGVDDRFDGVRFIAASDYKTSKSSTPGGGESKAWSEGVVLQVPLYAWALQRLYPHHEVARVDYLALRKPEAVHRLQPWVYRKTAGRPDSDDAAQSKWQASLEQAVAHVRRARAGQLPAAPPSSCPCPPWCQGKDVCRVKPVAER